MTVRPTALIAEDEELMRTRLREALADAWPELVIAAEVPDGDAALEAFEEHKPSVAFLDIRMPGKTGLDVAAEIGSRCHVVFITAYDQYALAAFEAGAADYLLKPVEPERLALAVERVKRKLESAPADLSGLLAQLKDAVSPTSTRLKWIKAAVGRQVKLIAVADVLYFQSDTKYTRVVLAGSEALIRTPSRNCSPSSIRSVSGRSIAVQLLTSTRCPAYCARTRKNSSSCSRAGTSGCRSRDSFSISFVRCSLDRGDGHPCILSPSSASPRPKAPGASLTGSTHTVCRGA